MYHNARESLEGTSLLDTKNPDIVELYRDVRGAVTELYEEPLKETLTDLFEAQTEVNRAFTQAGQLMYDGFKKLYDRAFALRLDATDEEKLEWLKEHASVIPGIAGAASHDKSTKLTFLKNVLEATDDDVVVYSDSGRRSANTVSRTYGDPGVGPAVLTILSLDSTVLARAINNYYKGTYVGIVPVHDAIVLGVGDFGIIIQYNKEFIHTNKDYSIAEEFVTSMKQFEKVFSSELDSFFIKGADGKNNSFKEVFNNLSIHAGNIDLSRKALFESGKIKTGQMVGPNGTAYVLEGEPAP